MMMHQPPVAAANPQPYFYGTITHNPIEDAEKLRKAMKGIGTDESALIKVLANRCWEEKNAIIYEFQRLYKHDLIKDIKSETSGNFQSALVALLTEPCAYDVEQLYEAMKGAGTNENTLIEILVTRSNAQKAKISQLYHIRHGKHLSDAISSETSSHFKNMLIQLLAPRDETTFVDPVLVQQDVDRLYKAGEGKLGTDEKVFIEILTKRNYYHLREVARSYEHSHKRHSLQKAIESEFSGDIKNGLLAICNYSVDPYGYFAFLLHDSMAGAGTKNNKLIRTLITQAHIIEGIKTAYSHKYGKTLHAAISSSSSSSSIFSPTSSATSSTSTPNKESISSSTSSTSLNQYLSSPQQPVNIKDQQTSSISWITAQLYGVSSATSLPNNTDFGENGKSIFASPTTFLASDLYIPPGQSRSYIYYVTLPTSIPPSFKGTSIKYSYFLSIAAQLFTNPAQILTVPIRVLTPASALRPIKFKSNIINFDFEEGSIETTQENSKNSIEVGVSKWPISPYKKSQHFPAPYPQTLSQYDSNNTKKSVLDLLNKHSTPVSINISKGTEKLATFSICRTAFSLGDTVSGTFDFSIATIPCYKILVKLECEESIDQKYLQQSRGSNKPIRRLYGELHEYTTNIRQTHFMFHIPVEASQEFSTKYVSVKWSLRFEFVTPLKPPSNFNPHSTLQSSISSSSSITQNQQVTTPSSTPSSSFYMDGTSSSSSSSSAPSSQPTTPKISSFSSKHNKSPGSLDSNQQQQYLPKNQSFNEDMTDFAKLHHQHQQQFSNRTISEIPSDNESSYSENNSVVNEETLSSSQHSNSSNHLHRSSSLGSTMNITNNHSSGSSSNTMIPSSTTTTTQSQQQLPTKRMIGSYPIIGVLKDDNSVPPVDTLHWSLPIRVLVSTPPHELVHTNKNELILN
eukprot:gene4763-5942_t